MAYKTQIQPNEIYRGSRAADFIECLKSVFKKADLTDNIIQLLLNEKNRLLYGIAFTALSADPANNYERFEQRGDSSINKFIVDYMYRRFPQLDCTEGVKFVARLKIYYPSKQVLSKLARQLGFWNFISASKTHIRTNDKKYYSRNNEIDLLEDTFEAFIGCTEHILDNAYQPGVGYGVVYRILESIYDEVDVSLKYEDIFDPKTILSETIQYLNNRNRTGSGIEFQSRESSETNQNGQKTNFYEVWINLDKKAIGYAKNSVKVEAEKLASKIALKWLEEKGLRKPKDTFDETFCPNK